VEKLKDKIKRWRLFTRTTLVDDKDIAKKYEEEQKRLHSAIFADASPDIP
jgi:hypothetical protein